MVALKPIPVVLGAGIVFRMYSGDLGTDVVLAIPSDLLNLLGSAEKPVGFKSLRNAWTDMATAHGRLMLTLLSVLAECEMELIRTRTGASVQKREECLLYASLEEAPKVMAIRERPNGLREIIEKLRRCQN
ncbi:MULTISPECIES: recombinase family protein [unclassified Bradyrhizobium]|uniref:recombinase family protein n=1 Tax=unclassified Bradyrhizobium TaxID=2631580 RepID=UPI001FF7D1BA|nr:MULTISPECIES: recombinase family protein [unclassified Bradyrhizobium]MCK1309469.1 recombinase family protein [Bradyrhizobium sp. 45]MCK1332594.1 recombinase family protein [Bradyrhizobium sp. CW9]MCK1484366.1 recombinase family protein [Bradyrhizobium sp. 193]MCK1496235.1 recombinase family protein [Bradyrhizobium sp. 188]MCK1571680.1 recombinase family protein [Bradyrhizobium sp. 174]